MGAMQMSVVTSTRSKHQGQELDRRIRKRSAKLGMIGLGYAGLHLALDMARNGFQVTGIDIDGNKVESVKAGIFRRLRMKRFTVRSQHRI